MKRIFLVGCPRSGTSIVQRCLAAHPDVHSFPESRFFRSVEAARPWLRRCGIASRSAHGRLVAIYRDVGIPHPPRPRRKVREYFQDFVSGLDVLAMHADKTWWLEKTPDHVRNLRQITRVLSGVRVVHLVRDASQTIASLVDVTRRYPEKWGGEWSVDACTDRWCRDVEASLVWQGHPNHAFLRFEEFVEAPARELERLCTQLKLPFHPSMLETADAASSIVLPDEPWKQAVREEIAKPSESKFAELLTREEQARVLAQTRNLMARVERL